MRIALLALLGLVTGRPQGFAGATQVEDAVLEALIAAKLGEFRAAARASSQEPTVFCLAVNPGNAPQTPGRDFMARFKNQPDVRPAGYCEPRGRRVAEIGTGIRALLLTVGPVEWISTDEAWVTFTVLRDHPYPPPAVYRVVRERDRWTALGPVMKISPV